MKAINPSNVQIAGNFTISFSEISEAQRAIALCRNIWLGCGIVQIPPRQFAKQQGLKQFVTDYEGQVVINVYYNGNKYAPPVNAYPVINELKRLLGQCGEVKAFRSLDPPQSHLRQFRAEFFNADAAIVAKDIMTSSIIRVRYHLVSFTYSSANNVVYCPSC